MVTNSVTLDWNTSTQGVGSDLQFSVRGKERFCLVLQTKLKRIKIKPKYIKDEQENEIVATRGGGMAA